MSSELERLASSCILPGFEGPTVPDWMRRRLAEGLGGVVLYAWNLESHS
jgi:beta-N-acetylhexosaminidase